MNAEKKNKKYKYNNYGLKYYSINNFSIEIGSKILCLNEKICQNYEKLIESDPDVHTQNHFEKYLQNILMVLYPLCIICLFFFVCVCSVV